MANKTDSESNQSHSDDVTTLAGNTSGPDSAVSQIILRLKESPNDAGVVATLGQSIALILDAQRDCTSAIPELQCCISALYKAARFQSDSWDASLARGAVVSLTALCEAADNCVTIRAAEVEFKSEVEGLLRRRGPRRVLELLFRAARPLSATEIAAAFPSDAGISAARSKVSKLISELLRAQLIERALKHERDGRHRYFRMTELGTLELEKAGLGQQSGFTKSIDSKPVPVQRGSSLRHRIWLRSASRWQPEPANVQPAESGEMVNPVARELAEMTN